MTASLQLLRMGIAASSRLPIPPGAALALESRSLAHLAPGTQVGTWPDLSGTGHHGVQATTSAKPTVRFVGALPTAEFNGVNHSLDPSLVLGSSLTIMYVSIPVADYGTPAQDGKDITSAVGAGVKAYTGSSGSSWRAKWALSYAAPVFLTSTVALAVGVPYASGLAADPTGYTSYHQRSSMGMTAKAELLPMTTLRIGSNNNHRLVAFYAWPRRLTTAEYQSVYDYVRGWMAGYGAVLP